MFRETHGEKGLGVQGAVEGGRGQPSPPIGPQGRGDRDRVKQGHAEALCYRTNPLVSHGSEVRKFFSVKGQRINIISFMGQTVSVTMTQLCCLEWKPP